MLYLADTNILLRFVAPTDPNHALVRYILYSLLERGESVCYLSQNLAEFWNVCTRPATSRSGFGLSIEETHKRAQVIERHLTFLPDNEEIHTQWRNLIVDYKVCGVQVYDARIVAAMRVHNIRQILSFNTDDFVRYSNEIQAIHPSEIGIELGFQE